MQALLKTQLLRCVCPSLPVRIVDELVTGQISAAHQVYVADVRVTDGTLVAVSTRFRVVGRLAGYQKQGRCYYGFVWS